MQAQYIQLVIGFVIGCLISYLILLLHFNNKLTNEKKKTINQSRNTILGEVSEKVLPLLPDFPYQTKDLVFLGKGVDYVVFNGLSKGKLKEIIFLEVKSGGSILNRNETMIKDYLQHYPVKYEVMRVKY